MSVSTGRDINVFIGMNLSIERGYAAPKRIAAPRGFMFFFCGRSKVG